MKASKTAPIPAGKTKIAPHRKAIQEASKIVPGKLEPIDYTQTTTQGLPLSQQEMNEDYETSKVGKSKKAQYDADVQAVQDLDRWG